MKKSLYLFILMLGSLLPTQAQQTLYFHCKDGKSFACMTDEIDHIGFSKSSGSEYDNQIVFLKDGTQQEVLTAEIDSVGFNDPAPVLKDNGFVLDKTFSSYISNADTLKFTMAKNTPASMLPKEGDVVTSTYDNTAFPDGIIARVVSITETADGYLYQCEKAGIDDLYEEFFYYGYGQNADAKTRADIEQELWNINLPSAKIPAIIIDDYTVDPDIHLGSKGKIKVLLQKNKGETTYARLTLSSRLESSLNLSITGKNATSSVTPLTYPLTLGVIVTPIWGIFFKPTLGVGFYTEAAADMKATFKAHANLDCEYIIEMKDGQWSAKEGKSTPDAGIDEASLSIDGWVGVGFQPEVFLSFCGTKTGTTVQSRVGLRLQGSFKFDAAKYFEDNSFYEGVKNSQIAITVPLQGWFNAQAGLFGPAVKSADIYFLMTSIPLITAYFVPAFNDLVIDDSESGNYHVSANLVDRIVFMPCDIGLAVFDKDNKLIESQYLGEYSLTKKTSTISTTFKLDSGKDYTFAPIVKLFGIEMRASGTKQETGIIGSWYANITTWTKELLAMDGYTWDDVDKRLEVYTFHDDGTYEWGYYYYPGIWEVGHSYASRDWYLEEKNTGTYTLDDNFLSMSGYPGLYTELMNDSMIEVIGDKLWYGLFYDSDGNLYGYSLSRATDEVRKIMKEAKPL